MIFGGGRATLVVVAIYASVVAGLLGLLPFWLDELLQLAGTHPGATMRQIVEYVPQNPGGVPLGYFVQHWILAATGLTRWTARLSAAGFGIATCGAVAVLARKAGLGKPWIAAAGFALLPLMVRYTTEGRPYSQALFLSVAATIVFLRLVETFSAPVLAAYLALLIAGVYTQPFVIFAAAGHCAWAVWERRWRVAMWTGAAGVGAALSFVPWWYYAHKAWTTTIATNEFRFVWTARTPLMILREFSGAGYWGSGLLLVLAALGYRSNQLETSRRRLLAAVIAACLLGGMAADAAFGYFIAIRQFLWMVPPIIVLAAAGVTALPRRCATVAGTAFAILCVYKSAQYFREPKEDWSAAAEALGAELKHADCYLVSPPEWKFLYEFVKPELVSKACRPGDRRDTVVAVVTPYTPDPVREQSLEELRTGGYTVRRERSVGRSQLVVFTRTQ